MIQLLFFLLSASPAFAVTITQFTPRDLSNTTNQMRAVFSDPMVALGVNPSADIFTLNCKPAVTGAARWDDDKTLTFDFKTTLFANQLPGGTVCKAGLRPGVKSLKGEPVTGTTQFEFQIDGPNLLAIYPGEVSGFGQTSIQEDQAFLLAVDGEILPASLTHAYFKVDGVASPVSIQVLSDDEKKLLLKSEDYLSPEFSAAGTVLAIQAKNKFPAGRKVTFVWGAGIQSAKSKLARSRDLNLPFEVRPALTAQLSCTRENAKADCSPLDEINLSFSAPIATAFANKIALVSKDGRALPGKFNEKNNFVESIVFPPTFEEKQTFKIELPKGIQDDAGRELSNAASFPLSVTTASLAPLAKFAGDFGLVELASPYLPVTLRHLKTQTTAINGKTLRVDGSNPAALVRWMKRLDRKLARARNYEGRDKSIFTPADTQTAAYRISTKVDDKDSEVVGIELKKPGLHIVELQSRILGKALLGVQTPMHVSAGALVTNMVVHSKWGRENSLFWVTKLDEASVVGGAQVTVTDCAGKVLWTAKTDAQGRALYKGELRRSLGSDQACMTKESQDLYSEYDRGFFVFAQNGEDVTFTHSSWTDGIEGWRFGDLNMGNPAYPASPVVAHTVLDRTLLRAGSTVSMKHFIRQQVMSGFKKVSPKELPDTVVIRNFESDTEYSLPVKWDAAGTATSEFTLPKDAKLGNYAVELGRRKGESVVSAVASASFQVLEFKVPLMKGTINFPDESAQIVRPGKLLAQLSVAYQDGGPAMNEPVTFRYTVDRMYGVSFANYQGMAFGFEPVTEGRTGTSERRQETEKSTQVALKLDKKGSATHQIRGLGEFPTPRILTAQLEFTDKTSELQNVSRTVKIYPSRRLAAVKVGEPYNSPKRVQFQIAVVDLSGQPQPGVSPDVQVFSEDTFTHRTRMVGGFYASESYTEFKKLKNPVQCAGVTDKRGVLDCQTEMDGPGSYIVQATVRDAKGNASYGRDSVYVAGSKRNWFPSEASDRMDLLIADRDLKSGTTAEFEVKMPFPEAQVLVTVEREGILDSFVTKVSTSDPVIKVPIKASYAPNVYVSAVAVRGRAGGGEAPGSFVDLGKPAYKVGIVPVNVDWSRHSLKVEVKPAKEIYKPREQAVAVVKITDSAGRPAAHAEFAIAVVDEGLLELAKNSTWDLLKQMMNTRSLEVQTATAQMQVVGKRHFGLKARPSGGDGGSAPTRELFDTLVYWKARLKTDAKGELRVPFTMNDSLTKFRIAAIAHQGVDRFGFGEATILSKQDLVVIPSLSQFVRAGDRFAAEFTLRNTTSVEKAVSLGGQVSLEWDGGRREVVKLPLKSVKLAAMDSSLVNLGEVEVKTGVRRMSLGLSIQKDGARTVIDACSKDAAERKRQRRALDNLCITQEVKPAVPVRTWMAQMSRVNAATESIAAELPPEALAGQGGIQVSLLGSLAGQLETVKSCVDDYPFRSLEYSISRAVTFADKTQWLEAMKMLPSHVDGDGLVMYYPSRGVGQGSDALTAYILSMSNYTSFPIPESLRTKLENALTGFVEGRLQNQRSQPLAPAEIFVRRLNAIEVLARLGKANPVWLTSLPVVAPEQVPTKSLIDQLSIYTSLKSVPQSTAKVVELTRLLDARLVRTGRSFKLVGDRYQCHCDLASHDVDQLRLILVLSGSPALSRVWEDALPKMVLGAVELMKRGAWDLTVANAYGVLAMNRFAAAFEKQKPRGLTTATLDPGFAQSFDWNLPGKAGGGNLNFGWKNPGRYKIELAHQGTGAPWATVSVQAAVPLTQKIESHIQMEKTVAPDKTTWKRGETATVTLTIKAQSAFSQVSLIDPIPAGAKIIEIGEASAYPDFQELAADSYRATYGSVAPEQFKVVYKIRLGNAGVFQIPSTRIEALYSPENFAEVPGRVWKVEP